MSTDSQHAESWPVMVWRGVWGNPPSLGLQGSFEPVNIKYDHLKVQMLRWIRDILSLINHTINMVSAPSPLHSYNGVT